jgi:hypothetical protein
MKSAENPRILRKTRGIGVALSSSRGVLSFMRTGKMSGVWVFTLVLGLPGITSVARADFDFPHITFGVGAVKEARARVPHDGWRVDFESPEDTGDDNPLVRKVSFGRGGGRWLGALKIETYRGDNKWNVGEMALEYTPFSRRAHIDLGYRLLESKSGKSLLVVAATPALHSDRQALNRGTEVGVKLLGKHNFKNIVDVQAAVGKSALWHMGGKDKKLGIHLDQVGTGVQDYWEVTAKTLIGQRWGVALEGANVSRKYKLRDVKAGSMLPEIRNGGYSFSAGGIYTFLDPALR